MRWHRQGLSDRQRAFLERKRIDLRAVQNRGHASAITEAVIRYEDSIPATAKQLAYLDWLGWRGNELAKWFTIYFAEHEGSAERWLRYAAERCDRNVPDNEVGRLLIWAEGLFGGPSETCKRPAEASSRPASAPQVDLEEITVSRVRGRVWPNIAQVARNRSGRYRGELDSLAGAGWSHA